MECFAYYAISVKHSECEDVEIEFVSVRVARQTITESTARRWYQLIKIMLVWCRVVVTQARVFSRSARLGIITVMTKIAGIRMDDAALVKTFRVAYLYRTSKMT